MKTTVGTCCGYTCVGCGVWAGVGWVWGVGYGMAQIYWPTKTIDRVPKSTEQYQIQLKKTISGLNQLVTGNYVKTLAVCCVLYRNFGYPHISCVIFVIYCSVCDSKLLPPKINQSFLEEEILIRFSKITHLLICPKMGK